MTTASTQASGASSLGWVVVSPARQPAAALVLRLFLGATFTYAGTQKLTDPGFFRAGSTSYIGTTLNATISSSPIGSWIEPLGHHAVAVGALMAAAEITVGIGTLLGILPAIAAAGGLLISVSLWLTVSFRIHPYFLGSDTIYAVAWLSYLLSLPPFGRARLMVRRRKTPETGPVPSPQQGK